MMIQGPVVAMVFEGVEAVSLGLQDGWRTSQKSALPGTIRGDFSHMSFEYADGKKKGIPNSFMHQLTQKRPKKKLATGSAKPKSTATKSQPSGLLASDIIKKAPW